MPKDSNDKPNHPGIDLDTMASKKCFSMIFPSSMVSI
jgi:hypothetical protein